MPRIDLTKEQFLSCYDWAAVFGENTFTPDVREALPGSNVALTPIKKGDVAQILALVNGEHDGESWRGVFRLKDGRYLHAEGGCCYTGWDCQGGAVHIVANTLDELHRYGITNTERTIMGYKERNYK
jgi:hypothetical protein